MKEKRKYSGVECFGIQSPDMSGLNGENGKVEGATANMD